MLFALYAVKFKYTRLLNILIGHEIFLIDIYRSSICCDKMYRLIVLAK